MEVRGSRKLTKPRDSTAAVKLTLIHSGLNKEMIGFSPLQVVSAPLTEPLFALKSLQGPLL